MINKIKCFVDMDGCLTFFDKAVKKLGPIPEQGLDDNATIEQKQAMYDAIEAAGESFWANLEWIENGKKLWEILKSYKPVLLSSPGKFFYAPSGKIAWINKNLPGTPLFLEKDKWIYAEPNAILIDDNEDNVRDWDEAGGLGILYENDPEAVKEELKRIMKEEKLYKQGKKKIFFKIVPDSIVKGDSLGHLYCETFPQHPNAMSLPDRNAKYIQLHRVIMENHLGHLINSDKEEIHHKDGNPENNKLSNLKLTTPSGHAKTHSKKVKFWKKSPRNKPGRKSALRVLLKYSQSQLRFSDIKIPPSWEKELKELRKKEPLSPSVLKEKSESIKKKIQDKTIKEPHLFLKSLNKIINYVGKMYDPSKHGLQMDLSEYFNKIIPKIRRDEKLILEKDFQKDIIDKAEKLKDDGTLLKILEELLTEKYVRASVSDILRRIAKIIYHFSIASRQ